MPTLFDARGVPLQMSTMLSLLAKIADERNSIDTAHVTPLFDVVNGEI